MPGNKGEAGDDGAPEGMDGEPPAERLGPLRRSLEVVAAAAARGVPLPHVLHEAVGGVGQEASGLSGQHRDGELQRELLFGQGEQRVGRWEGNTRGD